MDNLSAHKSDEVREAIEAAGAKLRYLPPYSPDLNPIEQAFSNLKAHLRKHKERSSKAFGTGSLQVSHQPNAETSFATLDMRKFKRAPL